MNIFSKCLHPVILSDNSICTLSSKQLKFYFFIMMIMNQNKNKTFFEYKKTDIIKTINYSNNNELFRNDVEILSESKFKNQKMFFYIDTNIPSGLIQFLVSDGFRKKYNDIKSNFILFEFSNIIRFTSPFTIILYCLLKQYVLLKKRVIGFSELKKYANVANVYKNHDFCKNKLQKSINEINSFSDIYINYKISCCDKTFHEVIFDISNNEIRIKKNIEIKTIYNTAKRTNNVLLNMDLIETVLESHDCPTVLATMLRNIFHTETEFQGLFF